VDKIRVLQELDRFFFFQGGLMLPEEFSNDLYLGWSDECIAELGRIYKNENAG